jgi:hypothetical protein
VALKPGIYKLSGWIRTQGISTGTTRGVRLQFDRRPAVSDWKQTDLIGGTQDWTLFEVPDIVVSTDAIVTIRLENFNNIAGTVWFDDLKLEEQKSPDVQVFMLYPNFRGMLFDDQSQTMKFRPDRHAIPVATSRATACGACSRMRSPARSSGVRTTRPPRTSWPTSRAARCSPAGPTWSPSPS